MAVKILVNVFRAKAVAQSVVVPPATPSEVVKFRNVERLRVKRLKFLQKLYWLTAKRNFKKR